MKAHPAAELFPLMDGPQLDELAADIKRNGLRHPIVTHEGEILDGRNRELACGLAGVEPTFEAWDGTGSPTAYVLSVNLPRRHLNADQRAFIAVAALPALEAEAAERRNSKLKRGDAVPLPPNGGNGSSAAAGRGDTAAALAAAAAGVSARTVERAKQIQAKAPPKLLEAVRQGDVSIGDAAAVLEAPEADLAEALKAVGEAIRTGDRKPTLAGYLREKHAPVALAAPHVDFQTTVALPVVRFDSRALEATQALTALSPAMVVDVKTGDGFAVITFAPVPAAQAGSAA